MKPGVTIDQATADAKRMIPIALQRFPPFPGASLAMFEKAGLSPQIRTTKADLVGDVRNALWVLMGTIALVLLIACANVANLLLVRAESRQQELAVKAALGADSGRIVRELLMESLTLAAFGGVLGLVLAFGAVRLLVALEPGNLPRLDDIAIDLPVLAFAVVASLLSGLLFGVIPAFKQAGGQLATTLRAGGRSVSGSKERERARNVLVVAQVALALVLLVSSGLMIRTFQALVDVHPGFVRPGEVQTLRLFIPDSQVKDDPAVARAHQTILERLAAVPGVSSVSLASTVTMSGRAWHDPLFAEDRAYGAAEVPPMRMYKFVSPGYMKTLGGSIVAGREFTWDDAHQRRPVAMVSATVARELWGGPAQAIGKRVRPYSKGVWREVVGVVTDMRDEGITKPAASTVYWPISMAQFSPDENEPTFALRSASYLVRSERTGTDGFVRELERAVWSVNPNLPLASVRTLQEIYDESLARTSFTLVMLAIAGAMALVLGVAGIYGVISYAVAQRPPRDRDPHRARGASSFRDAPVRRARHGARRDRHRHRPGRSLRGDAADVDAAVRGQRRGSADVCAGVADALRGDRTRLLRARLAGDAGRSDRRAPRRLGARGSPGPESPERVEELGGGDRGRAELADGDASGVVRQLRSLDQRSARREGDGERGDHGVSGAGDVGDFARFGRQVGFGDERRLVDRVASGRRSALGQPQAVLAAGDHHRRRSGEGAEGAGRRAGVGVVADPHVRRHFGFVVVRRDQRGAGVGREVRDLGIDQHRDAGRGPAFGQPPHQARRDGPLQVVGHDDHRGALEGANRRRRAAPPRWRWRLRHRIRSRHARPAGAAS